ncbi:MAG TPA: glycosyltransferase [Gaiellaceae bacterium]|jgi:glycosyltransferase involved in cell wall biosynthesis|nr:glycosyltransferase [Gaiellaceae bacterium]
MRDGKTPILFHSNSPWVGSGYGKQTKLFSQRIRERLDHPVAISSYYGLRGARLEMNGIPVYPRGIDAYGNDVLEHHATAFFGKRKAGLVIPVTDIWVLRPDVLRRLNVAAWTPVDHEPLQPPTRDALSKTGTVPIAMSRFAERMFEDADLESVYVPHGVDTTIFRPLDRRESRKAVGLPEQAFVVAVVAANQGKRKGYPEAIRAFARFRADHPDAVLYLHTWLGPQFDGHDLKLLLDQHELADCVRVCDPYRYHSGSYGDEHLAMVYASADVLLNPAQGEGFGVCLVEAQACGTPVIATNFSAMTELCGAGALVDGEPTYTSFQSWQLSPSTDAILDALEHQYALPVDEAAAQRARARDFALSYDADHVTDTYWAPALKRIAERVGL